MILSHTHFVKHLSKTEFQSLNVETLTQLENNVVISKRENTTPRFGQWPKKNPRRGKPVRESFIYLFLSNSFKYKDYRFNILCLDSCATFQTTISSLILYGQLLTHSEKTVWHYLFSHMLYRITVQNAWNLCQWSTVQTTPWWRQILYGLTVWRLKMTWVCMVGTVWYRIAEISIST